MLLTILCDTITKLTLIMANQPIPIPTALVMIGEYIDYMSVLGVDMNNQTHSVSFGSDELLDWMQQVKPYTDEFRICLAAEGERITVIVWPYMQGEPASIEGVGIEPFNEGERKP